MSYSILRVSRVKGSSASTGLQMHNQREGKKYTNPDIDLEKSHLNYDLINPENINYREKINEKLEEGYNGKRKIRSDAIKHVDGIITSDDSYFKYKDQELIRGFFETSLEFLEKEYGADNLLYATIHMDEKTPHMHFGFVPLTPDGRLSAKDILGNKTALSKLQDRFNESLNEKGYKLERGESVQVTKAKNKEMTEFKHETNYHKKILAETKEQARTEKGHLEDVTALLKEPPELQFTKKEKITEVTQRLIGKSEVVERETDNVILTPDEVKDINEQLQSALLIQKDYERLKATDLAKENERLTSHLELLLSKAHGVVAERDAFYKENISLKKEVGSLKERIRDLTMNMKIAYISTRNFFKDNIASLERFKMIFPMFIDKVIETTTKIQQEQGLKEQPNEFVQEHLDHETKELEQAKRERKKERDNDQGMSL